MFQYYTYFFPYYLFYFNTIPHSYYSPNKYVVYFLDHSNV